MALPPKLVKEIEQLELKPEITEDGGVINLVFRNYPIPPGYNSSAADLLVRVPLSYPDAGPDMFWTSPPLSLTSGAPPQAATAMEIYFNRQWQRFSWHTNWKPNTDNLHGYMHFIRRRLEQAR
jgi:Prokaryotic E2 family E